MKPNELSKPKRLVASGIVFSPDMTAILMINNIRYHRWMLPGGHLEANERPDEALTREILEETGLHINVINSPWYQDVNGDGASSVPLPFAILQEDVPQTPERPAAWHIDFIYVCHAENTYLSLNADPVAGPEASTAKWLSPESLHSIDTFITIRKLVDGAFRLFGAQPDRSAMGK